MTIYRLIAPKWLVKKGAKPVLEGQFEWDFIQTKNKEGYNVYAVPNHPSTYSIGTILSGGIIDLFDYVFVDFDLKDGVYGTKEAFIDVLYGIDCPPTKVVDSGWGIHAYWKISNLDAMSYLRLSRRLQRFLHTDDAVGQIFQLMRVPGTINTKIEDKPVPCTLIYDSEASYTCEELDKFLPPISMEDEKAAVNHFNKTYGKETENSIEDKLPAKFGKLIKENKEAADLFINNSDDRSKNDFRLGHLMFANGFTRHEALSVLINSVKAITRAPSHRKSYAENIVDKIWTFETSEDKTSLDLSMSVKDILQKGGSTLKGTPFRCHERVDNTEHGFRLGQVIGLVAGSGVGKTAFALNMFRWFCQKNPDYHHFFIPLEQPANEIADRWNTMCGADTSLHEKVHVISNYDENGAFRHLSFEEIKEYIEKFQTVTGNKIGCIVIDHIGALKKKGKDGENQDLMDICHAMKAFAVATNTLLVMQSQSSRAKAGIGDIELDKDAAYGTMYFEAYCDYLITLWQPLKRMHSVDACPTVTAFKFCKIRHKRAKVDVIKEDVPYYLAFDPTTEQMRDMTQDQERSFDFFIKQAINKRKADRKTELVSYKSTVVKEEKPNETRANSH